MLTVLIIAYLIGSIPFGLILTRMAGTDDLRAIGSGNIGATNVLRTGRKELAAATLLLDMAKGAGAVLIAARWFAGAVPPSGLPVEAVAALGVVIGHCFPVWLRFRGGKGVATLLGVGFGLAWPIGLISACVWLGVLALTRVSSLSGMASAIAAPLAALLTGHRDYALALAVLAVLVVFLHRANIARLRAGTEPRGSRRGSKRAR